MRVAANASPSRALARRWNLNDIGLSKHGESGARGLIAALRQAKTSRGILGGRSSPKIMPAAGGRRSVIWRAEHQGPAFDRRHSVRSRKQGDLGPVAVVMVGRGLSSAISRSLGLRFVVVIGAVVVLVEVYLTGQGDGRMVYRQAVLGLVQGRDRCVRDKHGRQRHAKRGEERP